MNRRPLFVMAWTVLIAVAVAVGTRALAEPARDAAAADPAAEARPTEAPLPPGLSEQDMQAMARAATPGPMHEHLGRFVGTWTYRTAMWMAPDTEPIVSDGVATYRPLMDGRYVQLQMTGQFPGMPVYQGMGLYAYDNVAEQFQAVWIDNHNTGITRGTGQLSPDGKTLAWSFTHHCPLVDGERSFRQVVTLHDENAKTLEMFGSGPADGEEFKVMQITFTRKSAAEAADH